MADLKILLDFVMVPEEKRRSTEDRKTLLFCCSSVEMTLPFDHCFMPQEFSIRINGSCRLLRGILFFKKSSKLEILQSI